MLIVVITVAGKSKISMKLSFIKLSFSYFFLLRFSVQVKPEQYKLHDFQFWVKIFYMAMLRHFCTIKYMYYIPTSKMTKQKKKKNKKRKKSKIEFIYSFLVVDC